MIITKCWVQDFGKLHEFEIDLKDGLNKINEENGWGKSTLATFLKAILFGLPQSTKQDLDKNDRQKYMPWDKNKFGGYVEFLLDGKNYRIERWFGTKQNQDSATLYDIDLNKVCTTYTPNIMEEFFNINCETFERSTYISQGEINCEITDGIRAKLGNLLQNETENNFKRAIEIVLEKRKEKQPLRGKGGESEEIQQKIDELTKKHAIAVEKKTILLNKQSELLEQENQIVVLEKKLENLQNEIKELDKKHTKNAEIEHYESLQQELEKLKAEYQAELNFFKNNVPDEMTINTVQNNINSFNEKQTKLNMFNDEQKIELDSLNKFFAKHLPTDKEIDNYVEMLNEAEEKQKELLFRPQEKQETVSLQTKNPFHIYSILGILIAVLGTCFATMLNQLILGICLGAFGAICFVVAIVLGIRNKKKQEENFARQNLNKQRFNEETNKTFAKKSHEIEQLRKEINSFILMFKTPSSSPMFDLSTIKANKTQFDALKKQNEKTKQAKESLKTELVLLKNDLDRFFANYFMELGSYQNMLNTIELKLSNHKRIEKDVEEQTKKVQEYVKQKNIDTTQKITEADLQKYNLLNQQKIMLTQQLNELNTTKGQTFATIKNLDQETCNITLYENELINLKEKAQEVSKQVEVFDYVKTFLENANETLTQKYISPMTQNFLGYLNKLLGAELGKISIDSNMNLTFEQKGSARSKKYLSAGLRDVVDLCMRFALVDSIFPNEKPTIVLDDPFVNLDDKNTKRGLELLQNISKDRQIIYFSCHSSRA